MDKEDIVGNLLAAIVLYPLVAVFAIVVSYLIGVHFPSISELSTNYVTVGLVVAIVVSVEYFSYWCIKGYQMERRHNKELERRRKEIRRNITKVSPTKKEGAVVKTSIPTHLVKKYDIYVGDELEWNDDGEYIKFKKVGD
uniref:Uncharacterized protein n=1 Tax=viral metagenome TaxID=1070528 RepID=A0A6M3X5N5_9ZZZZ